MRISTRRLVLHRVEGLLLGAAAGALFGVSDVAIKDLTKTPPGPLLGAVSPWTLTAIIAGVVAFYAARRLLGDDSSDATALRAQASAERIGNRLAATFARLSRGRLAAARGDWPMARQHALAHLDACAEGGHTTYVPGCLDALAEIAAGLHRHVEVARLLGAAERVRVEVGTIRVPPEEQHWAAIEDRLRDALGDSSYAAARAEGAHLSNRQIGERMFVSPETVKTHVGHIFRKIGVHSRVELVARAVTRGPTD